MSKRTENPTANPQTIMLHFRQPYILSASLRIRYNLELAKRTLLHGMLSPETIFASHVSYGLHSNLKKREVVQCLVEMELVALRERCKPTTASNLREQPEQSN